MELNTLMQRLKLDDLPDTLDTLCGQASKEDMGVPSVSPKHLQSRVDGRHQKSPESRLKQARSALDENSRAV